MDGKVGELFICLTFTAPDLAEVTKSTIGESSRLVSDSLIIVSEPPSVSSHMDRER